ncbi:regulator of chromosome condensation 1/beta-lactamase-inhibitor protein II [Tribonema minus]|uniref:Regulator of chromosome condensation 1/beta-lactamase-inhibitor protein II n=1 Tax=Tribonema minus TaxID=303371 RepID=A0A836CAC7_9STRA|nr:regulator of chromosome condensation 1/beta-lactamase-inhibitor protein II [Tribonema minus]
MTAAPPAITQGSDSASGKRLVNVFSWGSAADGQLGHGDTSDVYQSLPRPIFSLGTAESGSVIAAAVGPRHSLLLLKNGFVLAMGAADNGRLGTAAPAASDSGDGLKVQAPSTVSSTAAAVSSKKALTRRAAPSSAPPPAAARDCDDAAAATPMRQHNYPAPVRLLQPSHKVRALACGGAASYALTAFGDLYAWGCGRYGALGLGHEADAHAPTRVAIALSGRPLPIKAVAAGRSHCVVLAEGNRAYAWGRNDRGQVGVGGGAHAEAAPRAMGWSPATQTPLQIACGAHHSLCVVAVKAPNRKAAALRVYGWGDAGDGRLGAAAARSGAAFVDRPVEMEAVTALLRKSGRAVVAVAAGSAHSMAVLDVTREVIAWGQGLYGQLGEGSNRSTDIPVYVRGLSDVVTLVAGDRHNAAICAGGALYTWGWNNWGEAGVGTCSCLQTPKEVLGLAAYNTSVLSVAAGGRHTVALTSGRALLARDSPAYREFQDTLAAPGGYVARGALREAMRRRDLDSDLLERPSAPLPRQPAASILTRLTQGHAHAQTARACCAPLFALASTCAPLPVTHPETAMLFHDIPAGAADAPCAPLGPPASGPEAGLEWCLDAPPPEGSCAALRAAAAATLAPPRRGAAAARRLGPQVVYRCYPCGLEGVCLACARACHAGHAVEVLFRGRGGSGGGGGGGGFSSGAGGGGAGGGSGGCACGGARAAARLRCRCRWSALREAFDAAAAGEDDGCVDIGKLRGVLAAARGGAAAVTVADVESATESLVVGGDGGSAGEARRVPFRRLEVWYEARFEVEAVVNATTAKVM